MTRKLLYLVAGLSLVAVLGGCAVIHHLPQLQTMGEFSRDKNVQHAEIARVDASYAALAAVVTSGKISQYPDKTAVLLNFGEPIRRYQQTGKSESWLYRQAIAQTAKDKIYLYFDNDGKLIKHQQEDIRW